MEINFFKSDVDFTNISYDTSQFLFHTILTQTPELEKSFKRFSSNDDIGSPQLFDYGGHIFAPDTIYYIKVLSDLIKFLGPLDNLDIIEIGGGYGGQCKIIYDLFKPNTYIIIDSDQACKFQKEYLEIFGIEPFFNYLDGGNYDLCISSHEFDALDIEMKLRYKAEIIDHSRSGYFITNQAIFEFFPPSEIKPGQSDNLIFFKRNL